MPALKALSASEMGESKDKVIATDVSDKTLGFTHLGFLSYSKASFLVVLLRVVTF